MVIKKFLQLALVGFVFSFLISPVFAWGTWGIFVSDTWNSNQLYAGSYFSPSSPYSGWTYNAYYPSNGYPVMGGGRAYPNGYFSGSYLAPSMGMAGYGNAYSGYPYTVTSGYGYGTPYGAPVYTTSDSYYRAASCSGYYGC